MDKHHLHITFHAEDVAVPEVIVEDEDAPLGKTSSDEAKKANGEKHPKHKKVVTHIHYDTLAVPEIDFEIEEE